MVTENTTKRRKLLEGLSMSSYGIPEPSATVGKPSLETLFSLAGGKELEELEEELGKITDPEELVAILDALFKAETITKAKRNELYNAFVDQVWRNYLGGNYDYLNDYISLNDLQDRIIQLGLDQPRNEAIFDYFLPPLPDKTDVNYAEQKRARDADIAWRGARGRAILTPRQRAEQTAAIAQQKAGTLLQPGTEFERGYAPTADPQTQPELYQRQKAVYEQKRAERQLALETTYGLRPDMADRQSQIDAEQARLTAIDKQRSEGQTADALIAMLNRREVTGVPRLTSINNLTGERFYDLTGEREIPRPLIPSELPIAESALQATNLGEGTKLRNFIASQIAETAEKMRPERKAWWERMTAPPPPEEPSYEDVLGNLTEEASKWQSVAGVAPSSEVAGDVAYGPGGLKAIAERAYAEAQGRIAGLKPGDFGTRTPFVRPEEEDPLQKALRGRKWWQEYTRLPGVATVPRLQRAVRFR